MKTKTKIILGAVGAATAVNCVRAAAFKPEKREAEKLPAENCDVERAIKHISGAIQIPTVSYPDSDMVDWSQFEKFHKFLEESYPLIAKNLEREVVSKASLLYRWKGTDSSLDAIALLSHQDVVPVSKGT
ncbi:MAG: hypothetical protein IJE63_03585, partial [Clostridia bacterium]|nr:hypothetical protein [Clostridia bacterium]